jgi:hypothetical protein
MKNFKGIALLVALFAINNVAIAGQQRLSSGTMKFIDDSKKKGMGFYFERGLMREDWLNSAAGSILYGAELTAKNKDSVIQKLNQMVDILVGAPLRSNQKITDDQYASIIDTLSAQIEDFVNAHVGELFI